jgi:hypothetical protein
MRTFNLLSSNLFTLSLLAAPTQASAQDVSLPACFAAAQTEALTARLPRLAASADELSRLAATDERVSGQAVYLLTRQLVLIERIQRRLDLHSDVACLSALDVITRDFEVLRRVAAGFARGDSEIGIDRFDSEPAQTLLAQIEPELEALADPIAALQPSMFR